MGDDDCREIKLNLEEPDEGRWIIKEFQKQKQEAAWTSNNYESIFQVLEEQLFQPHKSQQIQKGNALQTSLKQEPLFSEQEKYLSDKEKKNEEQSQEDDSEYEQEAQSYSQAQKMQKVSKQNSLKNCLKTFKVCLLHYLKRFEPNYLSHPIVKKMQSSSHPSFDLWNGLFSIESFRPILQGMFESRFLKRDISSSRVKDAELKKRYIKKISILRKAFEKGIPLNSLQ